MTSKLSRWAAAVLLFSSLALSSAPTSARRLSPEVASVPSQSERIEVRGLPNLGRVNAGLYRGGQPDEEEGAYERLRDMGIDIVVDLRTERDELEEERSRVEALGLEFVSIPWRVRDYPDHVQVARFLTLIRDNPDKRIFVHCRRGADRTGVMVAAYRMSVEGWTPEEALREMEQFRFRGFWFRHLRRYVERFPQYWEMEPAFARLRTPASRPKIASR